MAGEHPIEHAKIADYLAGRLPAQDLEAFEQSLMESPDLAGEVEAELALRKALRANPRMLEVAPARQRVAAWWQSGYVVGAMAAACFALLIIAVDERATFDSETSVVPTLVTLLLGGTKEPFETAVLKVSQQPAEILLDIGASPGSEYRLDVQNEALASNIFTGNVMANSRGRLSVVVTPFKAGRLIFLVYPKDIEGLPGSSGQLLARYVVDVIE